MCSSSICRTSARASTPTSTRWPTACAPRRGTACRSWSAIARIQSAAKRSKAAYLERTWSSFVGQFPIPMRHGMTIGELARLFNEDFGIGARLDVVPLDGWTRSMYFDETGLPWVIPSPNLPTLDSAIVYPGAVLVEGTMLSEGRGTTRPFEIIGAPWIDGERLAAAMNERGSCQVSTSDRCSSSQRSRSTRARRVAAASCTSLDRKRVSARAHRRRAARRVPPRRSCSLRLARTRHTNTSTTRSRSTSCTAQTVCAARLLRAGTSAP